MSTEQTRTTPYPPLQIVGLMGALSSGKSLVSDHLMERHGFCRISFAAPLKKALMAMGADYQDVWGGRKGAYNPLFGQTNRYAMQTLGTEWGRRLMSPDIWVNVVRRDIWNEAAKWSEQCAGAPVPLRIVIDDMRFHNEAALVHEFGGQVWTVHRPGVGPGLLRQRALRALPRWLGWTTGIHESERYWVTMDPDFAIMNHGTTDQLREVVDDLVQENFST